MRIWFRTAWTILTSAILHPTKTTVVNERGWPRSINHYTTRPKTGDCPDCGAAEDAWCTNDCQLLDPADYR